jgi:hypothetical protein
MPIIHFSKAATTTVLIAASCVSLAAAADMCGTDPNAAVDHLQYVQYFLSKPQDAPGCSMQAANGRLLVTAPTSNAAMTCPDMFVWKLFAEAVMSEFWKNWASDQETWPGNGDSNDPGQPLALCAKGQSGPGCCDPDSATNPGYDDPLYKAKFCPYFPGDHVLVASSGMPERIGLPPSKSHPVSFASNPRFRESIMREAAAVRELSGKRGEPDGRKIRQGMAELVFRNKSLFDFVFRNDLYNQEGIIKVVQKNEQNLESGAPYRVSNDDGVLSEIIFPVDSVMIKSNWLSRERAEEMGLQDDPAHPYVKMNITSPVTDNNGTILLPGEHWLVAFHLSSKDIPNWVWATFEHVNNPGRCDYTGCNDSFGYDSPDALSSGQARNYVRPHQACDMLPIASWVLDLGKPYAAGNRRPALDAVFASLGIGTKDNTTLVPSFADRAWKSYALKGSQVDFTDSMGRPTRLGNSVTEGGFVSSSSCMSCHARAGANANGTAPLPLSVFQNEVTDSGYLPGALGIPVPDWFNRSAQPPTLQVLQTDFVWGFLAANSLKPSSDAVVASPASPQGQGPTQAPTQAVRGRAPSLGARIRGN